MEGKLNDLHYETKYIPFVTTLNAMFDKFKNLRAEENTNTSLKVKQLIKEMQEN